MASWKYMMLKSFPPYVLCICLGTEDIFAGSLAFYTDTFYG